MTEPAVVPRGSCLNSPGGHIMTITSVLCSAASAPSSCSISRPHSSTDLSSLVYKHIVGKRWEDGNRLTKRVVRLSDLRCCPQMNLA